MTPVLHFTRFGRYEIIRKLGRSMTDVYLALDPERNRRVVLKIVEQCRDAVTEAVVDAERRGAIIQQQLHALDPRILEIYEYGEQDGCFFLAMQYAEGKSLAEILHHDGRLEPPRAARYAAEVASQLATLHTFQAELDGGKRAVVHGDIKPSNIQIGLHDEVWLLDFGIAKAITLTRNLTSHNLGSPAYCSPERLRKAQVDPHADLWALGVSLYEMVGGLPPYQAQSTRNLENLILSRRPPRALPETCPPPLRAIVSKALAADIERRYPSATAFETDLRSFLTHRATAAEREHQPTWQVNATVDRARPETPPAAAPRRSLKLPALPAGAAWTVLAGLVLGLLWLAPVSHFYEYWKSSGPLRTPPSYLQASAAKVTSDFQLYHKLQHQNRFLGWFSPVRRLRGPLHAGLLAAANDVLDRYRNGSDPVPEHYDWQKARICLTNALELDETDADARGKLAVCDGYLQRSPQAARESFEAALTWIPLSPDPHLGLARIHIYGFHNVGQALAEFSAAERLGYRLGPREFEQQADGYLHRAEQGLRTSAMARGDLERARNLYEPIAGFSNVERSLERLYRDEVLLQQIQVEREKARLRAAAAAARRRMRRWR